MKKNNQIRSKREVVTEELIEAIENNNETFFKNNVPELFDVNLRDVNQAPLVHHVVHNNREHMLRYLIEHKVNLDATRDYVNAAYTAANKGFINCLKILVENGAEFTKGAGEKNQTPLQTASIEGQVECVQYLIGKLDVSQINLRDTMEGWTAAHGAAGKNQVECLKLLVEAGADLTIKSNEFPYETPLDVAKRRGCMEATIYLKQLDAPSHSYAVHMASQGIYKVTRRNDNSESETPGNHIN